MHTLYNNYIRIIKQLDFPSAEDIIIVVFHLFHITITHTPQSTDSPHKLTHFQYTAWPDHGVPLHPSSLVKFVQEVRKVHGNSQIPMVVHCR